MLSMMPSTMVLIIPTEIEVTSLPGSITRNPFLNKILSHRVFIPRDAMMVVSTMEITT